MKKTMMSLIFLLVWAASANAQFNFHWAFPYYSLQNMEIKNGNSGFLIVSKDKNYNNFPAVEKKSWGKGNSFSYANSASNAPIKNYVFMSIDGSQSIAEITKLHKKLPTTVMFFIHRETAQWTNDLPALKKILSERPGWAYGGDPYNPEAPIIRSTKSIFTSKYIILGNKAPGEGI